MSVRILDERPLGVQTVRGTVLFVDLRGYTTLAEGLLPDAVAGLLEEFFTTLTPAVERHGGTVFHLAGDSLMAGFGLDEAGVAPVRAAVQASRTMIAAFQPVSARWEDRLGVPTGIGIGVHVGALAFVALGPPTLRRATLVGDTVNVASRLCQRARGRGAVLGQRRPLARSGDVQRRHPAATARAAGSHLARGDLLRAGARACGRAGAHRGTGADGAAAARLLNRDRGSRASAPQRVPCTLRSSVPIGTT